jgi:hypothetical protein
MLVVPVMAAVTRHIGFGVTSNLTYEPPYLFGRRSSACHRAWLLMQPLWHGAHDLQPREMQFVN